MARRKYIPAPISDAQLASLQKSASGFVASSNSVLQPYGHHTSYLGISPLRQYTYPLFNSSFTSRLASLPISDQLVNSPATLPPDILPPLFTSSDQLVNSPATLPSPPDVLLYSLADVLPAPAPGLYKADSLNAKFTLEWGRLSSSSPDVPWPVGLSAFKISAGFQQMSSDQGSLSPARRFLNIFGIDWDPTTFYVHCFI
ncbi:hypothetical protein BDP27DRAFT_1431539 [Rhodocollybia butyracea]|uniref:Uncharacterized protein n=1 Tax=Rhodocollybia butyracea TaxID=206335 RepID=A0A9P5P8M2_9AGAR|nr:hypothetical protein BDP27DRAFT_1431539 [Rhodocollybia butyracea]